MISTRNGYWLIGQSAPTAEGEIMERDTSNHPGPSSDRVNITGADLTEDQLAALTPEQRTRLTSGEPVPVDPRSPLATDPLVEEPASTAVAEALDAVEGTGDSDGDGLVDHGTDQRDEAVGADVEGELYPDDGGSETPLADGLDEPAPWPDASDR